MAFYSAEDCDEVFGSRRVTFSRDGKVTARVILEVDAAFTFQLIGDLLRSRNAEYSARPWPHPLNTNPGSTPPLPLGVTNVNVLEHPTKYTTEDQSLEVLRRRVEVTYHNRWYNIEEGIEFDQQVIKHDFRGFQWKNPYRPGGTDDKLLLRGEEPLQQFPFNTYTRHFKGLSQTELVEIGTLVGSVNDAATAQDTYLMSGLGKGTLLMLKPIIKPAMCLTADEYGSIGYDVLLRWKHKPAGHHKFFRPKRQRIGDLGLTVGGDWDSLLTTSEDDPNQWTDFEPFEYKDHSFWLRVPTGFSANTPTP